MHPLCEVSVGIYKDFNSEASKRNAEFEYFLSSFEEFLVNISNSNSLFRLILGEFSYRSTSRWKNDTTSHEG